MSEPCANCGAEVPEGAGFCENCGTSVSGEPRPREKPRLEQPPDRPETGRDEAVSQKVPTRRVPAASPPPPPPAFPAAQRPPVSGPPVSRRNRRSLLPILGGLLVLLVGVGIAAWMLLAPSGPVTVAIPDVVGKPQEEAEEVLGSGGFEVRSLTRESAEEEAGRVVAQSPSGGRAEEGSAVEITVGAGAASEEPADGYAQVTDGTGALGMEVPAEWEVVTGADSEGGGTNSWSSVAGESIESSITAAPDLNAWQYTPGAAGAYVVASRTLAQNYTDDELLAFPSFDFSGGCQSGAVEDFDQAPFSGKTRAWTNCSGNAEFTVYNVAAASEGRECVVVAQIAAIGEADREVAQHIRDTFQVDCGGIASTAPDVLAG